MKLDANAFLSLEQVQGQYLNNTDQSSNTKVKAQGESFADILNRVSGADEVKFSKHAAGRLSTRNIELSDTQKERLNEGTKRAEEKGISESLVLVDELAFIVNVPSKTVVTAMDRNETQSNVFTNIDGAVII